MSHAGISHVLALLSPRVPSDADVVETRSAALLATPDAGSAGATARILGMLALLASSSQAFQAVHVVDGGSGSALQSVIDAAADGDTILVHGGSFDACHVAGKALTIVSEPEHSTEVDGLSISGTTLSQRTTIAGLRIRTPPVDSSSVPPECVVLEGCAGSVRIENVLASLQAPNGNPALRATGCSDVVLVGCELEGSDGATTTLSIAAWSPGAGVECAGSRIAAYETTITGGDGNDGVTWTPCSNPFTFFPTHGAPAVAVDAASTWYSSSAVLRGGNGGDGVDARCDCFFAQLVPGTNGTPGGAALENEAGSGSHLIGTLLTPGGGGSGGQHADCGGGPAGGGVPGPTGPTSTNPMNLLSGTPLRFAAPTRVRAGESLSLSVSGNAGDVVTLTRSFESRWVLVLPLRGVLVSGPTYRRVTLGTIPVGGTLSVSIGTGTLSPGVQAVQWHLQTFGAGPLGAQQVGGPFVVTILDPSL